MPATYTVDLEAGKEFSVYKMKLRFFTEIYNLFNRRNIVYVYPDTGDPDYTFVGGHSEEWMKNPANYGPPRIIRVGLGVKF